MDDATIYHSEPAWQLRNEAEARFHPLTLIHLLGVVRTMRFLLLTLPVVAVLATGCRRDGVAQEACSAKMKNIDGAIVTWAMDHHKSVNDVVNWEDLVGSDKYLRELPSCPHGGVYSITTVGAGPTCSIPKDTAYFRGQ
jgi:hypothetical protein